MKTDIQNQMARLETPRLFLEIITQKDINDVFNTLNYENTALMVSDLSWPMTLEQAQTFVDQAIAGWNTGTEFLYLARTQSNRALVGYGGFHHPESGAAEIGYWICEDHQGRGYASEITAKLIAQAFSFTACNKVYATTALNNEGSRRVLEKNGLMYVGRKDKPLLDGGTRPSHFYELYK